MLKILFFYRMYWKCELCINEENRKEYKAWNIKYNSANTSVHDRILVGTC